jgi:hypothetical protein
MKIKTVEITNVKGISNNTFQIELISNKPNILVAPNGFGKSSFSIAFNSLKPTKLDLEDINLHEGDVTNRPELKITIEDSGLQNTLIANDTVNNLNVFDVCVINSQLVAKATMLNIGGTRIAKSSMEISTTTLIPSIPEKVAFGYSLTESKRVVGSNGKILSNIGFVFQNGYLLYQIESTIDLRKFNQVRIKRKFDAIIEEINGKGGTSEEIKGWVQSEKLSAFLEIEELDKLATLLRSANFPTILNETDSLLAAIQIIILYISNEKNFKKASIYRYYLEEKEEYVEVIKSFNATRLDIKPVEDKKKGLIVEWPKAHQISNGQRDILSFITLMLKARRSFRKKNCILIIDEIFDYLDDANLISFQYFITNFIEDMKRQGKNFFPILMTHLDPMFFNHFCFNKHKIKVHYLKDITATANQHLLILIRNREAQTIKDLVDKHYFHYHPSDINIPTEFASLGLNAAWAQSNIFHSYIQDEVMKYTTEQVNYDPLAICFGVRVKVEKLLYDQITEPGKQQQFLDTHGTKNKLDFCEQMAINVPEIYYLLGIIYNDKLHWHNTIDIVKPLAIKLENFTIKHLIKQIFR